MIATIQQNTLVVADLTEQDLAILASLLSEKGVGDIERVLSNLIREIVAAKLEQDNTLILESVLALTDDQRHAIVDIVTGKTDVSSTRMIA